MKLFAETPVNINCGLNEDVLWSFRRFRSGLQKLLRKRHPNWLLFKASVWKVKNYFFQNVKLFAETPVNINCGLNEDVLWSFRRFRSGLQKLLRKRHPNWLLFKASVWKVKNYFFQNVKLFAETPVNINCGLNEDVLWSFRRFRSGLQKLLRKRHPNWLLFKASVWKVKNCFFQNVKLFAETPVNINCGLNEDVLWSFRRFRSGLQKLLRKRHPNWLLFKASVWKVKNYFFQNVKLFAETPVNINCGLNEDVLWSFRRFRSGLQKLLRKRHPNWLLFKASVWKVKNYFFQNVKLFAETPVNINCGLNEDVLWSFRRFRSGLQKLLRKRHPNWLLFKASVWKVKNYFFQNVKLFAETPVNINCGLNEDVLWSFRRFRSGLQKLLRKRHPNWLLFKASVWKVKNCFFQNVKLFAETPVNINCGLNEDVLWSFRRFRSGLQKLLRKRHPNWLLFKASVWKVKNYFFQNVKLFAETPVNINCGLNEDVLWSFRRFRSGLQKLLRKRHPNWLLFKASVWKVKNCFFQNVKLFAETPVNINCGLNEDVLWSFRRFRSGLQKLLRKRHPNWLLFKASVWKVKNCFFQNVKLFAETPVNINCGLNEDVLWSFRRFRSGLQKLLRKRHPNWLLFKASVWKVKNYFFQKSQKVPETSVNV